MQNHFFFFAGAAMSPLAAAFPAAAPKASFFFAVYLFSNSAKLSLIVLGSNFYEIWHLPEYHLS